MNLIKNLAFLLLIYLTVMNVAERINPPDYSSLPRGSVTLYATAWCGYCAKTRKFFEKHSVPFVDLDIEREPRAKREYDRLGGVGVPLIKIGDTLIRGYDANALIEELETISSANSHR